MKVRSTLDERREEGAGTRGIMTNNIFLGQKSDHLSFELYKLKKRALIFVNYYVISPRKSQCESAQHIGRTTGGGAG